MRVTFGEGRDDTVEGQFALLKLKIGKQIATALKKRLGKRAAKWKVQPLRGPDIVNMTFVGEDRSTGMKPGMDAKVMIYFKPLQRHIVLHAIVETHHLQRGGDQDNFLIGNGSTAESAAEMIERKIQEIGGLA